MKESETSKLIIGIKGRAGAGKDTVAEYLARKYNFVRISFAHPLKHIVSLLTGWPLHLLKGDTAESRAFRELEIHPDFGLTPRNMLQIIGTDVFRNNFDPDIWVKIAKRKILESHENVVISDVRFPNEVAMIQSLGGYIFSIRRPPISAERTMKQSNGLEFLVEPCFIITFILAISGILLIGVVDPFELQCYLALTFVIIVSLGELVKTGENKPHESEMEFQAPNEIIIENNGTFEELYTKIDNLIG